MMTFLKTKKSGGVRVSSAVHRLIKAGNEARDRRAWDDAITQYRQAIDADPGLAHIWVQIGHAEKERGRQADAEAAYIRAALLRPSDADTLLQLGHIYKLMGNVSGAFRAYLRAVRLDVSNAHAMEELQRLIAGTAPFARADLITFLRGEIFGETSDGAVIRAAQAAGDRALLFDVSGLVSAVLSGHSFAEAGVIADRLVPALIETADRPSILCAHVIGHGRWLSITPAQFARVADLGRSAATMGPIERQQGITDLDLSFLLSEPLDMPAGATLIDLDAGHAPADHALFVQHARRAFGVRYVAFGAVSADLQSQADARIDGIGPDGAAEAVRALIAEAVAAGPATSVPDARLARIEQLGAHNGGAKFRVGTGWLPPEDWGCWAAMPGGDLEIRLPKMAEPRLYLELKALPTDLTRYQISLSDGRQIHGEIEASRHKWVVIDDLPSADGLFRLRIRGENSQLVSVQGTTRKLPAMIGVAGFYVCARADRAARTALLETKAFGDPEALY